MLPIRSEHEWIRKWYGDDAQTELLSDYRTTYAKHGAYSSETKLVAISLQTAGIDVPTAKQMYGGESVATKPSPNIVSPANKDVTPIEEPTGEELIKEATDQASTNTERVRLHETLAKETLAPSKVKQSTEQYKSDLDGVSVPLGAKLPSGQAVGASSGFGGSWDPDKSYWRGEYFGGGGVSDLFDILRTLEYAGGGSLARTREAGELGRRAEEEGREMTEEEEEEFFDLIESSISFDSSMYGIKHRISPSAVGDIKNPIAALLFDISQDPLSYVSGGVGSATKIGGRITGRVATELGIKTTSKVAIKKEGVGVLSRMIESGRYSYDEASELLLEWMAKHPEDAAKWMHQGGVRWAGVTVVPGKYLERGWDAITRLRYVGEPTRVAGEAAARGYQWAEKIPSKTLRAVARPVLGAATWAIPKVTTPIRRGATRVADWAGGAFGLGYKLKQSGEEGAAYFKDYIDWVHRKKGAQTQAFHALKEMAGDYSKRGKEITKYVEEGVSTGDEMLDEFIEGVVKPHAEKMRLEEVARGIDIGEMSEYVPHILTKKGASLLKRLGTVPDVYRYYGQKVRAHYAEARDIPGTISEINEELGVEFFEPDYWKAMMQREQKHVSDIYTADWFKSVQKKYGLEAPITDVKKVLTGEFTEMPYEKRMTAKMDEAVEEVFKNVPSPFTMEEVGRAIPFEELRKITGELQESLDVEKIVPITTKDDLVFAPLKEFIESEKTGLFAGTYKSSKRQIKELEEVISTYREIYGDPAKREEWISTHLGTLRGAQIQTAGEGDTGVIERFVSQEVSRITHAITVLPPIAKVAKETVFKRPTIRPTEELRQIEDKFLEELSDVAYGMAYKVKRRGEPIYEDIVTHATSATEGGIDYVLSKHPQLREKLLPSNIAKHIEEIIEPAPDEPVRDLWRWAQSWWKRSVTTGIGPALHTPFFGRNVLSGIFQNVMAGIYSPVPYARGVQARMGWETPDWMAKAGLWPGKFKTLEFGEISAKEMQKLARTSDVFGQPGMTDINVERLWHKTTWEYLRDMPGQVMAITEDFVRMPLFTKRLETTSARQAREAVTEYHFDYDAEFATRFENRWMKLGIPFYTWPRRSIPLAVEYIAQQPGKIGALGKGAQQLFAHYGIEVADDNGVVEMPERESIKRFPPETLQSRTSPYTNATANLSDNTRYVPITKNTIGNVTQVYDTKEKRTVHLTDWQQDSYVIPNVFSGGEDLMILDLPFTGVTTKPSDMYFMTSPFLKAPFEYMKIESGYGSHEYKREKEWELLTPFIGQRYAKTAEKLGEKETNVEKALYMVGLPTYAYAEPPTMAAFEAAQWVEPVPTKEQEYAAWEAAGMPMGVRIKTFAKTAGGPRGMRDDEGLSNIEWLSQKAQFWKEFPEEPEEPIGEFSMLALTEDVYERSRQFKLTPEQEQYVFTTVAPEAAGAKEKRYEELLTEWEEFKSGEITAEYPTEAQRMESWRRASEPEKYVQKIYRDELGKLLGVSTYTPEEMREMGTFKPTEAMKAVAFAGTDDVLPKERMKMWAALKEETGKMAFDEQMKHWSEKYVADQEQQQLYREEYGELRADIRGTTKIRKDE